LVTFPSCSLLMCMHYVSTILPQFSMMYGTCIHYISSRFVWWHLYALCIMLVQFSAEYTCSILLMCMHYVSTILPQFSMMYGTCILYQISLSAVIPLSLCIMLVLYDDTYIIHGTCIHYNIQLLPIHLSSLIQNGRQCG
jgi:hypothetical protein